MVDRTKLREALEQYRWHSVETHEVEVEVPVLLGDVPDGRYLVIPIDSL
jgi:hypothetical protein